MSGAEEDQKDCSICKLPLDSETAQLLPCNHNFDKACIEEWFKSNAQMTCPFRCILPTYLELRNGIKITIERGHAHVGMSAVDNPWNVAGQALAQVLRQDQLWLAEQASEREQQARMRRYG
jgi:hypothetical protein